MFGVYLIINPDFPRFRKTNTLFNMQTPLETYPFLTIRKDFN